MSARQKPKAIYYTPHKLDINESAISQNALVLCKKLSGAGYSTQLVGGCIRDLILDIQPKDFDIATAASPAQIQKIFPGSRVIGQRFKIVHLRIKGELLEITTYRRAAQDHDKNHRTGQVIRDNMYGSIIEDASRRDFTINALYYDPSTKKIIDYFNGINDLDSKRLRLIGDPQVRFAEDPGRILRTVRFQAKYNFDVSPEVIKAIHQQKHNLDNVPPARRFDELLKLFYSGQAKRVWLLLNEYNLLPYLFAFMENESADQTRLCRGLTEKVLHNTDLRVKENKPVISAFMLSSLLWPFYEARFKALLQVQCPAQDAMIQASEDVISRQLIKTSMLRRVTNTIRDIWWMQHRLETSLNKKALKVIEHQRFRAGYDFLLIRAELGNAPSQTAQFWTDLQECKTSERDDFINKNKQKKTPKKPRISNRRKPGHGKK